MAPARRRPPPRVRPGDDLRRENLELRVAIVELVTLQAMYRQLASARVDSIVRTRLVESRRALDLDGYLVLLRGDVVGPLLIALSDGVGSETALALASSLGRRRAGFLTEPRLYPDLHVDSGPLADQTAAKHGSLAVLPMLAGTPQPMGFLALLTNRPGGIAPETVARFADTAHNLATAIDAALDHRQQTDHTAGALAILPDRAALRAALGSEVRRARRLGLALTLAVVQVDSLRTILEEAGTEAGTALLEQFSESLHAVLRASDRVGRLGGGRFAAILIDCDAAAALQVADKLRANASRLASVRGAALGVSVGVGTWLGPGEDAEALLTAAEHCLDQAIADGGDQSVARPGGGRPGQDGSATAASRGR